MTERIRNWKVIRMGSLPPPPPVIWLHELVPLGHLVLVEGEEGIGKGYFLCWALVQMASGKWGPPRAGVYISSEEEPDVIQARLLAAGYLPGIHAPIWILQVDDGDALVQMPEDRGALVAWLRQFDVGIVAVDPLRDHCAPTEDMGIRQRSNNDETWIRPAARAWKDVAVRSGATVLGAHHRNKSETGSARSKSTGSGAWRQVARGTVVLAEAKGERAVSLDKNNLGPENKVPWSFTLESVSDDFARFELGDRLTDHPTISTWEAAMKDPNHLQVDPADDLLRWCQGLDRQLADDDGDLRLPTQENLQARLGMSRRAVRDAVETLRSKGYLITKPVRSLPGMSRDHFHNNGHKSLS